MLARFIHAADLHLDTPLAGLTATEPEIAEALMEATFVAWERIVDLCIAHEVDGLLIAGDVYNRADRSLRAQLRFVDGLERLSEAGIRCFFCHGNHDPLDGWEASHELPPGIVRFPAEPAVAWLDDERQVAVVGASYPTAVVTENLAARFRRPPEARFAIGLLHCNVGGVAEHGNYAPVSVEQLSNSGFDYWALGHVHSRRVLRPHSPAIVYPGNPQGLHVNEPGERGVYLVEVGDDLWPQLDLLPVGSVRWEQVEVVIDRLADVGTLLRQVEGQISRYEGDAHLLYRLRVSGRGDLHAELSRPGVASDLRDDLNRRFGGQQPFAWCESVRVTTRPAVDRAMRRDSNQLSGMLLGLADEYRADPRRLVELRALLDGFYQHPRLRRYGDEIQLDDAELIEVLDQAETLLLNALEES